jgi:preprotein translocase subunit SecE
MAKKNTAHVIYRSEQKLSRATLILAACILIIVALFVNMGIKYNAYLAFLAGNGNVVAEVDWAYAHNCGISFIVVLAIVAVICGLFLWTDTKTLTVVDGDKAFYTKYLLTKEERLDWANIIGVSIDMDKIAIRCCTEEVFTYGRIKNIDAFQKAIKLGNFDAIVADNLAKYEAQIQKQAEAERARELAEARKMTEADYMRIIQGYQTQINVAAEKTLQKRRTRGIVKGAAVGGIVAGPAGAVVGAIAAKDKQNRKHR